jgi:tRNA1(Val) A37 N6-methylase TrmN6
VPVGAISGTADSRDVTVDAFLGGRVEAVQPARGHHRAGLEAVLLAASVPADTKGIVVDLGAGAGVAGLCIAAKCDGASVVLVERDEIVVECAHASLCRQANSSFADRVRVVKTDIAVRHGLPVGQAEAIVFNPPFYRAGTASASPAPSRSRAHMLEEGDLDLWFRAAAALGARQATATIIFRADGLDLVLAAAAGRFGGLEILPIAPRADQPALRILVRGTKGSRAPLRLLPALILHNQSGAGFRPDVDALLRDGAELSSVVASWNDDRHHPF